MVEYQKDWACVLQLYQLLLELVNDQRPELDGKWKLLEFNYKKIVIGYGAPLKSNADRYSQGFGSNGKLSQFSSIATGINFCENIF